MPNLFRHPIIKVASYLGVAFGPRCTLILREALATRPVSAAIANAPFFSFCLNHDF